MEEKKPVHISLDNITICGSPSDYVLKNIRDNPLIKEGWVTLNQLYHYNYPLINGGFLQIKHPSDWYKTTKTKCRTCKGTGVPVEFHCEHGKIFCRFCHGEERPKTDTCEECGGHGGKLKVSENAIRIEFNPNQYQTREGQLAIMDLLKNVWNPHVTRRDVAFDFYDEPLNNYTILDDLSRKRRLYLDRSGKFETLYIGANKSDIQIRIYNKALEKDLDNVIWWRVEAQMRKVYADTFFFNPFAHLRIKRNMDFNKYDFQTRCILKGLVEDPSGFNELSKPTRLKYKKMLMEDIESVELKISDMFQASSQELYQELESWIAYSKESNRRFKGSMSKPDTILKSEIKHVRDILTLHEAIEREKAGL